MTDIQILVCCLLVLAAAIVLAAGIRRSLDRRFGKRRFRYPDVD